MAARINNCPIITISREFYAGGRTIARMLAEQLNIPWYDKDFVKATVKESGISEEDLIREGEELSKGQKFLDKMLGSMVSYTSSTDAIFEAQKTQILELAKNGPCIIVGRCADTILTEAGINCFNIFLYGDLQSRIERAVDMGANNGQNPKKFIETHDEARDNFHKKHTGKSITDCHNYDLTLNTGKISHEKCVDIILHSI